uniref:Imaginal disc growth factor n=1 Tax=Plectrocnemia conspersa TaxID=161770 RepID=A0A5Q0MV65_9NEOP|nr:imaginal disc growth factor [Plectrocnemia conspersa]
MAKFFFILAALCAVNTFHLASANVSGPAVFCYYDSRSYLRETQAKMLPSDMDPALSFCTHLVYGYAGLDAATNKMVSLNPKLDLDQGHANFRVVTQLKKKFPTMKVLLSVGGGADLELEDSYKYNTVLETPESRAVFINSASVILKNYGFDGLDLAWQFPTLKPKKIRGKISSLWHGFKKLFKTRPVDEHAEEHKEQFGKFVQEMKNALRHDNMILTASVLPNINSSLYFDIHAIMSHIDYAILHGYDYMTPKRNPKEADYTSPLYELLERNPEFNINFLTSYWLKNGFPIQKLILAIPTFGRAWKLDSDSAISGVPPLHTDGPAPEGPYTKHEGLLSYPEICTKLNNPANQKGLHTYLRKVTDPSKRYGTYAFRAPDDNGDNGLWVSYEDSDTAANKVGYIKAKGLAGVAIVDLSLDDFRGLCSGDKYPILRSAKYRL